MTKQNERKEILEHIRHFIEKHWQTILATGAGLLVLLFLWKGITWMILLAAGGTVPAILKANQKAADKINRINKDTQKELIDIVTEKEELKAKIATDSAVEKVKGESKSNEEIKKDILDNIS